VEQQQDLQKRLLLALVLSFVAFILFDMIMPKTPKGVEQNSTKTETTQSVPNSVTTTTQAPAPVTNSSAPKAQESISNVKPSSAPITKIKARLNDGYSLDDFKKVIDIKTLKWKSDPKMSDYLRPETLFGNKFESYLNEKIISKEADSPYETI